VADALELHVTMPNAGRASALGRTLVEEGLVACVNVVPGVRSIYLWQGKVQEDDEVLCLIKTRPDLYQRVQARILALHPYEVPEILAFAVDDGSPGYLAWLRDATPGDPPPGP
jgi:periplasmic divalent cation tolerance protein